MNLYFSLSYGGLFLSSFMAATILPFSSEGILSYMIYQKYNYVLLILFASIGNTFGGITSYYLGRLGKLEWLEKRMNISLNKILKTQKIVNKYRGLLAFFCWLPIVGDLLAVSLGYFKCKEGQVFVFMLLGKTLRYILWMFFTLWSLKFFN